MKKFLCTLLAIFIFSTSLSTAYASARAITATLELSFEDSIASCGTMITANNTTDEICAVIRLCYEGERIKVWYASDECVLAFDRTYDISDYGVGTYEITVDFTINGESYPRASMEREYQGG